MKYYILTIFTFFLLFSCENLEDLNVDKKNPSKVHAESLLTTAQQQFMYHMGETNVNFNNFRLFAQYWNETQYLDEANYDLVTRNIPEQHWEELYRDVLKDLKEAKSISDEVEALSDEDKATKANLGAVIEVTAIHAWSVLVETFGDIPYSEALDIENTLLPAYDDQKVIYLDLLTRLDAAIASITVDGNGPSADLIYGGNMDSWNKYANSLKFKMGMRIADSDAALSQATAEAAVASIISSNDDNATITYETNQPNTNPLYVALVASGRHDFIPANTLVDRMIALNDPRMDFYFDATTKKLSPKPGTTDSVVKYWGGNYGSPSSFAAHSHIAARMHDADFPGTIMNYSEMEFLLAEAAERGYAVSGTAEEHYNAGVTASIMEWTGSDATAAAYLAQPNVAYSTATGDWKQKIGMQKWLALYNRGYEAWTEWRRLDAPSLNAPPEAKSELPKRYTYPIIVQSLNGANYTNAAAAIGGDNVATKLFWDKN